MAPPEPFHGAGADGPFAASGEDHALPFISLGLKGGRLVGAALLASQADSLPALTPAVRGIERCSQTPVRLSG